MYLGGEEGKMERKWEGEKRRLTNRVNEWECKKVYDDTGEKERGKEEKREEIWKNKIGEMAKKKENNEK